MPDIRELGQRVKAKYPGVYDAIDDAELGRRVKAKYPGAYDQFTDTPAQSNVSIGTQSALRQTGDWAQAAKELVTSTLSGDFRPLRETAELAGRGLTSFVAGGLHRAALSPKNMQTLPNIEAAQGRAIAEVNAQRQVRRASGPDAEYWRRSAEDVARLNALAAQDPSLRGKLTRGAIEAIPAVLMGAASGGSIPLSVATGAATSLNEPENLLLSAGLGAIGGGGARVAERTLGRGVTRAVETEAGQVARGAQQMLPGMEAALTKATAQSPWQDTVLAYYRANLLTNPAGRISDLGSTVINQFADAAARPIAAAVDVVVSKLTGARSITGPSLRGTGRAFGSIGQGLREAKEVLRTGKQAIESGAADAVYSGEIRSGLGKLADVPVNGVFRVLGALDAPFRRFGFARNLYDRAKVAAINEAKRDLIPRGQLTARVRELLDDPDIIRAAVRDGEATVLSEPNRISSWLAAQTHGSANARLAIGLVQPFMRIPLNAVLRAADFSGLGGIKAMYKIARGVGRKASGKSFFRDLEDQRVFSQNVAAGSFAPAAFILGMELEERGKMNGYFYTSKKDYPQGRVPTSVNIGGENYDINRLGGFIAAPLFVGATYNRLRKQDVGKANALLRSFSGLVQTAPALGYYGVPAKAGRLLAAEEPLGQAAQEAGSTAAGFIPASGAMRFTAKALDPIKKRLEEGFTGPILGGIPGLRQRLAEKPSRQKKRGRR